MSKLKTTQKIKPRKCAVCGKLYTPQTNRGKFCSKKCNREHFNAVKRQKTAIAAAMRAKKPKPTAEEQPRPLYDSHRHDYKHTYAAIQKARRVRPPVQSGWRGCPCMGGGRASADPLLVANF